MYHMEKKLKGYFVSSNDSVTGRTARAGKSGTSITILRKEQIGKFKGMRQSVLAPEKVDHWVVDKGLARTIVPMYRQCLFSLREVLEAEEHRELSQTETIPSYFVTSKDSMQSNTEPEE